MGVNPSPWRSYSGELHEVKKRLKDLERRSAWAGSGMTPLGDGQTLFNPGIVPNAALGTPTIPGVAGVEATNFAVDVTMAEVAGVDLTVPTGVASLLISATAHVFAVDSTAVDDSLWVSLSVGGFTSTPIGVPWLASGVNTASCSLGTVVSGLSAGGVVRLGVWASSTAGLHAADVDNTAAIAASLTWQP